MSKPAAILTYTRPDGVAIELPSKETWIVSIDGDEFSHRIVDGRMNESYAPEGGPMAAILRGGDHSRLSTTTRPASSR